MFSLKIISKFPREIILRRLNSTAVKLEQKLADNSGHVNTKCRERLLKVAIIGSPNAGKSTIINALMDRKVCAVSSKVHTTRVKAKAVFTDGDSQIIFIDTPGLVHYKEINKFNLEKSFLKDTRSTLHEADVIGIIHDVSNSYTREKLDLKVINILETHSKKPSFLVLNKIDLLVSKRKLLDITRLVTEGRLNGVVMPNAKPQENTEIRGWPNFSNIFMISALTGSGLDDLRNYLITQAKPSKWMFSQAVWSDQSPEAIIIGVVKAQLLNYLQQEIPYQCTPKLEFYHVNQAGEVRSVVLVKCPTDRIAKLIAGGSNGRLRQITENVQMDLQDAFQNFVMIRIILEGPAGSHSL